MGDSSAVWKQVIDDDMAVLHAPGDDRVADRTREDGGCVGGSWHQVSRDNRFLLRTVMGRNPGSTDSFDSGAAKAIYSLDIAGLKPHAMVWSARQGFARGRAGF